MLSGLGNLSGLFKQAKELQERLAGIQKELTTRRYQGESGGGAVTATVDGKGTLVNINIQPDAVADLELLEDLIISAVRVAADKAQEAVRTEMAELTGGLNIPGITDLLSGPTG